MTTSTQQTPTERDTWHRILATVWARYQGQKGTEKQLLAIRRQLNIEDLERMLSERGYSIAHSIPQPITK